jgi:HEAT repeat protein
MDTEQPRAPAIPKRFSGNTLTASLLQNAVAAFSGDRGPAINAVRQLQSSDPSGLAHAAIQLLGTVEEKSLPLKNAVGLLTAGNVLAGLLLNRHILSLETGLALARKAKSIEPLLDIQLVRQLVANSSGKVAAIKNAEALHALELVDAISDCSRLGSYLIQFLNHPNDKVRSKAALMLGRSNWNLARLQGLLESDDSRLRANAVESLWGHRHPDVRKILWSATQDPSSRVVINALLGLCQAGDREAYARLAELANASDPVLRSGTAWAMGETGSPEFGEALEKLAQDEDAKVRAMAGRSQKKLPLPKPILSSPLAEGAEPKPSESTGTSVPARPAWLSGIKARP